MSEAEERPESLVVMFADISGSTRLYEILGDTQAKRLVTQCLDLLSGIARQHCGEVITTIGDEVMCCFADPAEAAAAACEMHVLLKDAVDKGEIEAKEIKVKIGMHQGAVLRKRRDLVGEAVDIARHVGKMAKPDETLTTREMVDVLPSIYRALTRPVCDEPWEGRANHLEVHELVWEVEGLTAHAGPAAVRPEVAMPRVALSFAGEEFALKPAHPVISVGRGPHNDIVVNYDLVSRQHLQIAYRGGRAVLIDNSTNGSLIANERGEETVVHRTVQTLSGKGAIYFGSPSETDRRYAVYYDCG